MGAQSFVVYPLLALPNTAIVEQKEALGLTLTPSFDAGAGDYTYVTATREVSPDEYRKGLWLVLSLNLLHNTRVLAGTFDLLLQRGIRHVQVLEAFAQWARVHDLPLFVRHTKAVSSVEHASWAYWGSVAFEALHAQRERFVATVEEFCAAQPWWDEDVRACVEVDRLLLPYLFTNTPLSIFEGNEVSVQSAGRNLRARVSERARRFLSERQKQEVSTYVELNPWNGQLPYFGSQPSAIAHDYAYGQLQRLSRFVPQLVEPSVAA